MKRRTLFSLIGVIVAVIVSIMMLTAFTSAAGKFTDVPEKSWYTDAVLKANELGIMNGTSETTFAPLKNLTRAEYVAILFRLSGGEENVPYTFTDVPEKAWYKKYVGWAEKSGVITGYGNAETFGGNELITREQLMLMTARYMAYEYVDLPASATAVEFADKDKIAKWAADGVEITRKAGLITGDTNACFNPKNPATRAEIAIIVMRYINALPTAPDPMHAKLDDILSLVKKTGNNIELSFPSGSEFISNYYSEAPIRKQLLTQMRLSLDRYELIVDEDEIAAIRSKFADIELGAFYPVSFPIAIRNVETGEETKSVKLSFFLRKYSAEYVMVDPDARPVEFDEDTYSHAIDTSLMSTGNIARLAEFFDKAERGENVTVGYIGGSITQGASALAGRSWSEVTQRWIEKYVDENAVYVNAGIGGTASTFGNYRLEKHILDKECDLVFVEFAVNNSQYDPFDQETFEALVRRLLTHEDAPAVVIVLAVSDSTGKDDPYKPMEDMSKYYDLPIVDTRRGLYDLFGSTDFTYEDFAPDGIHPLSFGHKIMGDMVNNLLKTVKEMRSTASAKDLTITVPEKNFMFGDTYYSFDIIEGADLPYARYGWSLSTSANNYGFDKNISTTSSASVLEFSFTGKGLLMTPVTTSVHFEVSIDGGDYFKVSAYDGTYAETVSVCTFDTVGTHTVKIRLEPESDGKLGEIVGIAVLK